MKALQKGVAETILDVVTVTGAGTAFALPARGTQITWQTVFGTAPSAVHIHIETSNNNSAWSEVSNSSSTTAEAQTINTSASFIRANLISKTGGSTFSVILVAKDIVTLNNGADVDATYATISDETSGLPNSRQLIASTNITLDVATSGQIKISSAGTGTPGGSIHDVQINDGAGAFTAVTNGTNTQVLTAHTGAAPTFEDAGGGGTPGGADKSIQFNNSAAFDGFGSYDGTDLTLTTPGQIELPGNTIKLTSKVQPPDGALIIPALANAGAGNLSNGVYRYKLAYNDGIVTLHTQMSSASSTVTVVDKTANGQVIINVPVISQVPQGSIYRTEANGSVYKYLASMPSNGTITYTDDIADADLGTAGPTDNIYDLPLQLMGFRLTLPFDEYNYAGVLYLSPAGFTGENVTIETYTDPISGASSALKIAVGIAFKDQNGPNLSLAAGGTKGTNANGGSVVIQGGGVSGTGNGGGISIEGGQAKGSGKYAGSVTIAAGLAGIGVEPGNVNVTPSFNSIDGSTDGFFTIQAHLPGTQFSIDTCVSYRPYNGLRVLYGDYISNDNSAGITTTITTGALVGKTITIKNGIITGFA